MNVFLDQTMLAERGIDFMGSSRVIIQPHESMCSETDSDGNGFLHFTVPTTVAEESAWQVLNEAHAVPAQLSVNLLSPAMLLGGPIYGSADIVRSGKQIMVAYGSAYQGDKLLVTVMATFTRFEKR